MQTPLQIAFRNLESSEAVVAHIHERAGWLERFSNQIISCRVMVEKPNRRHHTGNLYHVRIDIRLPGYELVVSRSPNLHQAHRDVYVAIHDAFDEARREVEDCIKKRRSA